MQNNFDLEEYLSNGIERIIKGAIIASLKNPKESIFITKFALASKKSRKIRQHLEADGVHIPPFIIASITNKCNLYCKGCYARANNSCNDNTAAQLLTQEDWNSIFLEAQSLGISFILLAGGEPFLRADVLKSATLYSDILFPIFTNGTILTQEYLDLLNKNRNLVPMLSIEGDQTYTDERRGKGTYQQLFDTMDKFGESGILFGASITVTKNNINQVTTQDYLNTLYNKGCKVIIFVEYVPITSDTTDLAPTDNDRGYLAEQLYQLRNHYEDMVFISFPGDEKTSGGCLAAGRGFFHINPNGAVEPCPFSPYSDTNIRETGLKEALNSPLFQKLKEEEVLNKEHIGGCVLFDQQELVASLCSKEN